MVSPIPRLRRYAGAPGREGAIAEKGVVVGERQLVGEGLGWLSDTQRLLAAFWGGRMTRRFWYRF